MIVKVDVGRAEDPAAHVRQVLRTALATSARARVEEVFPGLRSGRSAGLVSVHLACSPGSKNHRESLAALRGDDAVAYVEGPQLRRPF